MAKARRSRKRDDNPDGGLDGGSDGKGEGNGWKAARTWIAGIVSAVLIAAIGVVFTAWYTARGSDTLDRIGGEPPLTVGHVEVEYGERDLALREPLTDPQDRATLLGKAVNDADLAAMLSRHHIATIDDLTATVVLVGNRSSVRVIDIEPRILLRAPRSDAVYLVEETAGETGTVELVADLDRRPLRFAMKKEPDVPYFRKKQIDLQRGERVTLSLSVVGEDAYYEFDLVATVLAGEQSEQIVIKGPGGGPFRLTGRAGSYRKAYRKASNGGWTPMPPGHACTTADKC
ncbi:hypothetical protein ACNF49_28730 [Actinomadura sp. ATCC 39365]